MAAAPKLETLVPLSEELQFVHASARDEYGRVYITRIAFPQGRHEGDLKEHWGNLYRPENSLLLLRGQAVDYASDVEDLLHEVLALYLEQRALGIDLLRKQIKDNTAAECAVRKLDFMGRKNLLSSILGKDKLLGGKNGYTKLLNDIILDRNKYAHGKFYFHVGESVTVIQWKLGETKKCAKIEPDLLQGFADCCLSAYEWLSSLKNQLSS